MSSQMRFVVMGDTHYVQPDSHQEAIEGRPRGVTELVDLRRNYWMTQNVLPKVIESIAALKPDFVIQTGDIIQGHCDDEQGALREMREALDLLSGLEAPLFLALGTHDGVVGKAQDASVKQLVYPAISKAMGGPVTKGFYRFERNRTLFIVLDYTTFAEGDEQDDFIRTCFSEAHNYDHVFVFSHPPLIPVGRPFFTRYDFVAKVLDQIAVNPVDAYFCGHTHNQITSVHKIGQSWLLHLKSTVLGYPDEMPVALTDVRPLLPDPSTFEYGWGYLEDSAPGWWLITVEGPQVLAEWHVLNQGVMGRLKWSKGQKPVFLQRPAFEKGKQTTLPPLDSIKAIRLRAAGSNCQSSDAYEVTINNQLVGRLPRLEYFDCRQFLEIDRALWPCISEKNAVRITTAAEEMCIGGLVLEVQTESGWVRSAVSDYYTDTSKWNKWNTSALHPISPGDDVEVDLFFKPKLHPEEALQGEKQ